MPNRKDSSSDTSFFTLKRRKSPDSSDASNEQRRRITIACLRCRHRKIRCDGSDPCNKCKSSGTDCEYYAVTKEENQAAREKKALAKANRTKVLKPAPSPVVKSEEKKAPLKRRSAKTRKTNSSAESSATPEPLQHELYERPCERPQLHIEPQYHLAMPPQQPMLLQPVLENPVEVDDAQSASDCAENYFGYLSSSTTSLQSSVYEPVYAHENLSYNANIHEYHIPTAVAGLDPAFYGAYSMGSAESKMHVSGQAPPPLSYPTDSPRPSGLCLYIPPEEAPFSHTFTPYASLSTPATPMLAQNYSFPNPSPPMYQGPIDWNSRPLVPFQDSHGVSRLQIQSQQQQIQQLHHHHHHQSATVQHRPRSYSDVPMYSQTVSLDQVCSAGV